MSNEQHRDRLARIVIRLVGDRGLLQNVEKIPEETVHQTAYEAASRLMAIIDADQGRVEIEINGKFVEPELIGYWRMLAREAIDYPDELDLLVRSIQQDID